MYTRELESGVREQFHVSAPANDSRRTRQQKLQVIVSIKTSIDAVFFPVTRLRAIKSREMYVVNSRNAMTMGIYEIVLRNYTTQKIKRSCLKPSKISRRDLNKAIKAYLFMTHVCF